MFTIPPWHDAASHSQWQKKKKKNNITCDNWNFSETGESQSASDLNPTGWEENVNVPLLERGSCFKQSSISSRSLQIYLDWKNALFCSPLGSDHREKKKGEEKRDSERYNGAKTKFVCLIESGSLPLFGDRWGGLNCSSNPTPSLVSNVPPPANTRSYILIK